MPSHIEIGYQGWGQESQDPSHPVGTVATDEYGRKWGYFQASATLVFGNVVRLMNNTGILAALNADVDAAAAADTRRVTATGDFTAANLVSSFQGETRAGEKGRGHTNYLFIDAGATQNQGGPIMSRVSNDAVDVYWETSNDGKIGTALTTVADYIVYNMTRVELTTGPTDCTVCLPQIDVTDEYYFWGLMFGHGWALLDTADSIISTGSRIVIPSDTTDGYCEGETAGAITAGEVAAAFGRGFQDCTADGLVPFMCNSLYSTHPMAFSGVPTSPDANYPNKL